MEPGVVGLVGANGAGKSTLLKILLGLEPATSGSASVLGMDVATEGAGIRERVGYMPEHDALPPDVSATEFVVHMARMSGLPPEAARERTADTLRHVGLYEERYRPIGGYSTGMKQRVKLAQALVHDPQLVLLDEPTNGLDPVGRDEMLSLIRRIRTDFGISVLVTSHLLGELERTCDHVVVVDGGRLLRSSSTAEFTQATQILAIEVTEPEESSPTAATDRARQALSAAGLSVEADGGRILLVRINGDGTSAERHEHPEHPADADAVYDTIRDTIAELGLGLVRMEQRRHRIVEVFTGDADAPNTEDAPAGQESRQSQERKTDVGV
jgi:ABC-2 type transport system ATP-binding protein